MVEKIKLYIFNHKIIFISLFILLLGIVGFISFKMSYQEDNDSLVLEENNDLIDNVSIPSTDVLTKSEYISVDIKGYVKKPGVYRFDESLDRRVADVIKQAGGLLNNADTSIINLARKIFDEMVIIIFSKSEVQDFEKISSSINKKIDGCNNTINDGCITKNDGIDDKTSENNEKKLININTASKEELMTLTGIGESKAQEIIDYRNKTKFTKIEDIMNISGIGEKAFEKIKDSITV